MTSATDTKAESIPPHIEQALSELTQQIKDLCQDNLVSLILYGGLARGSYQENRSDINLMLVLKQADGDTLRKIAPALSAARRKSNAEPLILEEAEVARVADVFPVKILDIQRSHRILAGRDVFGPVQVEREHIRLSVEQALRNLQLRTRRMLATHDRDKMVWRRFLSEITRPLALELRQLLELQGHPCKSESTREIFAAAAPGLQVDGAFLATLSQWRDGTKEGDAEALAVQLLAVLGRAVEQADTLESEV